MPGLLETRYLQVHPGASTGLELCRWFETHPNRWYSHAQIKAELGCSDRIIREHVPEALNSGDEPLLEIDPSEIAWRYRYRPATYSPTAGWLLNPGEQIKRTLLHDVYGGGRQGGIAPSVRSPNVLIFTDPSTGQQHGYFDEWIGDVLHYAGEGQTGNQQFIRGNRAIRDHIAEGRALRVFYGSSGVVEYAGEFRLATTDATYTRPDTRPDGTVRDVIMFRLEPAGVPVVPDVERPARKHVTSPLSTPYKHVDPTKASAPKDPFEVDPDAVDRGLQGHARTQELLSDLVTSRGLVPLSPGPGEPNFDLAWRDGDVVYVAEVKSLTNANELGQIRLGLGQVLHYQALLEHSHTVVRPILAVEKAPEGAGWAGLCHRHGVALTWPPEWQGVDPPR